jgi:hypothetical protein
MPVYGTLRNIEAALFSRGEPAITRWNRLEGRPRTHHFDRALRAEIRDPLWMLTKQWQLGEFRGDDAGSPVLARICTSATRFDQYQAEEGAVEKLTLDMPLETKVERRPVRWSAKGQKLSLDLRLALGKRWLKLLKRDFDSTDLTQDYRTAYRTQYAIASPDPTVKADAAVCAHADVWQQVSAVAGRAMDGYALLEYLEGPGHNAWDAIGADPGDEARLTTLAGELKVWLGTLVAQPGDPNADAWLPQRLEYQFNISAPATNGEYVTSAEEYYQGHLDWYSLEKSDVSALGPAPSGGPPPELKASTFVPVSLVFSGMPNTRWWEFEERRTNFGEARPDRTDVGKLLLLEFGLIYANDWFVFPYTLPIGTASTVHGVAITNVFGERVWVEPVTTRGASTWDSWSMYQLTGSGEEKALILPHATDHVQEGPAHEEVAIVRDEMANLVYGIEKRVPMPSGASKPGGEAGRELFNLLAKIIGPPPAPPAPVAPVRYEIMNTVPEHWIPFLPVHQPSSVLETRLQRAAMPRLLGNDPANFDIVEPRTSLLREGLDATPRQPYFVNEEEVPRAGALVTLSYQRARWLNGRVYVWLGVTKTTGRGEASSGLAFDQLVPTDTNL